MSKSGRIRCFDTGLRYEIESQEAEVRCEVQIASLEIGINASIRI